MGSDDRGLVLIAEWELWACANEVLAQHGEAAAAFAARRISELEEAGDAGGVRTWRAIGERVAQLDPSQARDRCLQ
jgi:hypothetical protein